MITTQTTAPCPGCGEPLVLLNASEGRLAGCPGCGGMWLDNVVALWVASGSVSDVAREFVRLFEAVEAQRKGAEAYRTSVRGQRRCPGCGAELEASRRRELGFTVDVCRAHGVFFDRNELWAAIQHYGVASGAAVAARTRDLELADEQARSDFASSIASALVRPRERYWYEVD